MYESKYGNTYSLDLDYIGTYSEATVSAEMWTATSEDTFLNILDNNSSFGTYDIGVSAINDNIFDAQYMVFRFDPSDYGGDWTNRR